MDNSLPIEAPINFGKRLEMDILNMKVNMTPEDYNENAFDKTVVNTVKVGLSTCSPSLSSPEFSDKENSMESSTVNTNSIIFPPRSDSDDLIYLKNNNNLGGRMEDAGPSSSFSSNSGLTTEQSDSFIKFSEEDTPQMPDLPMDYETPLFVTCGSNKAILYLERLDKGSKGASILFEKWWLTPNEFQKISGRGTAKDWKRSIKHHGRSLKLLLAKNMLFLNPPICKCDYCCGTATIDNHEDKYDTEIDLSNKQAGNPPEKKVIEKGYSPDEKQLKHQQQSACVHINQNTPSNEKQQTQIVGVTSKNLGGFYKDSNANRLVCNSEAALNLSHQPSFIEEDCDGEWDGEGESCIDMKDQLLLLTGSNKVNIPDSGMVKGRNTNGDFDGYENKNKECNSILGPNATKHDDHSNIQLNYNNTTVTVKSTSLMTGNPFQRGNSHQMLSAKQNTSLSPLLSLITKHRDVVRGDSGGSSVQRLNEDENEGEHDVKINAEKYSPPLPSKLIGSSEVEREIRVQLNMESHCSVKQNSCIEVPTRASNDKSSFSENEEERGGAVSIDGDNSCSHRRIDIHTPLLNSPGESFQTKLPAVATVENLMNNDSYLQSTSINSASPQKTPPISQRDCKESPSSLADINTTVPGTNLQSPRANSIINIPDVAPKLQVQTDDCNVNGSNIINSCNLQSDDSEISLISPKKEARLINIIEELKQYKKCLEVQIQKKKHVTHESNPITGKDNIPADEIKETLLLKKNETIEKDSVTSSQPVSPVNSLSLKTSPRTVEVADTIRSLPNSTILSNSPINCLKTNIKPGSSPASSSCNPNSSFYQALTGQVYNYPQNCESYNKHDLYGLGGGLNMSEFENDDVTNDVPLDDSSHVTGTVHWGMPKGYSPRMSSTTTCVSMSNTRPITFPKPVVPPLRNDRNEVTKSLPGSSMAGTNNLIGFNKKITPSGIKDYQMYKEQFKDRDVKTQKHDNSVINKCKLKNQIHERIRNNQKRTMENDNINSIIPKQTKTITAPNVNIPAKDCYVSPANIDMNAYFKYLSSCFQRGTIPNMYDFYNTLSKSSSSTSYMRSLDSFGIHNVMASSSVNHCPVSIFGNSNKAQNAVLDLSTKTKEKGHSVVGKLNDGSEKVNVHVDECGALDLSQK